MSSKGKFVFHWKAGLLGGLAGGLVIGVIMAFMGMMPGIASMVGSHSAVVGFIVHIMISLIFGLGFSVFAGIFKINPIASGAVYGILLWVIFPLMIMPMMMGGAACGDVSSACGDVGGACGGGTGGFDWMSLINHIIFGVVAGAVYGRVRIKSSAVN